MLAEDGFAGPRQRFGLECVARRAFAKWGPRFERLMLGVDHRPAGRAPGREQVGDPPFGVGIVPRSPARIVEALLHVDEE